MTVRRSIDKLIAEPAIADLGYPADQRLVATVILGLKLLADSIDDIEARLTEMTRPAGAVNDPAVPTEMHDLTADIHDITEQVGKLANIIKKAAKEK
jgi:hypothetical protein